MMRASRAAGARMRVGCERLATLKALEARDGCSACSPPLLVPCPHQRASNGFGIAAVHFLEGVNYLVDEHICQQAEGAASAHAPGRRLRGGRTHPLLPGGCRPPVVCSVMGTWRCLLGLSPGFLSWSADCALSLGLRPGKEVGPFNGHEYLMSS